MNLGKKRLPHVPTALILGLSALLTACGFVHHALGLKPTHGKGISTSAVACDYSHKQFNAHPLVNLDSSATWSCNQQERQLVANGVPDHEVGPFIIQPDLDFKIQPHQVRFSVPMSPEWDGQMKRMGGPNGDMGFVLNGIKIDPSTGGSCDNSGRNCTLLGRAGQWRMEALGQTSFKFGADSNNAHVQPGGVYHYHGLPEGFIMQLGKGQAMTLIGWAADGFPIYARFAHSVANDSTSDIKTLKSSYRVKSQADAQRPSVDLYPMGTFAQDYEYVAGLGDLDECNGRQGVTPEFPQGIYHYFATDTYPYLQRCVKGRI